MQIFATLPNNHHQVRSKLHRNPDHHPGPVKVFGLCADKSIMERISPVKHNFRRKFPRRSFPNHVGLLIGGTYVLSVGIEIGEGGMSNLTTKKLQAGLRVLVSFKIGGGDYLFIKGTIVRSEKNRAGLFVTGISFDEVELPYRRQIRTFVASRKQNEIRAS